MDALARRFLAAQGDRRSVIDDPGAIYFGTTLNDRSLTPGPDALIGPTTFEAWLDRDAVAA
jgi:hypothetical protein